MQIEEMRKRITSIIDEIMSFSKSNMEELQLDEDDGNSIKKLQFNENDEIVDSVKKYKDNKKKRVTSKELICNKERKLYVQNIRKKLEPLGKRKVQENDKGIEEYYQELGRKINKERVKNWDLKEMFEKLSIQHAIWIFHFCKSKNYWEKHKLYKAYRYTRSLLKNLNKRSENAKKGRKTEPHAKLYTKKLNKQHLRGKRLKLKGKKETLKLKHFSVKYRKS